MRGLCFTTERGGSKLFICSHTFVILDLLSLLLNVRICVVRVGRQWMSCKGVGSECVDREERMDPPLRVGSEVRRCSGCVRTRFRRC